MVKIIGVDFDGTIAKTRYPTIESIIPEAQMYIRKLRKRGVKFILWTCREGQPLADALQFCEQHGITFDAVNENLPEMKEKYGNDPRKIGFDYLIDDKALLPIGEQWRILHKLLGG